MLDTDREKDRWEEGRKEGKYQHVKGQKITLAVVPKKKNLKGNYIFFSPHEVQSTHFIIVSTDFIFQDSA